jgi:menaquinone-specific isochorismate synthase
MSTAPVAARLVARTVAITDPGALLARLPPTRPLAWIRRGEGLVGWGEVVRFRTAGPDRITEAERAWAAQVRHAVVRDEVGLPGCGPVAFGSFSFSPDSSAGGVLVVPEIVLGRRGDRWWLTTVGVGPVLPGPGLLPEVPPPASPGDVAFADGALTAPQWEAAVAEAIRRIEGGALDKVVLARDLEARTAGPVDPRWVLRRLAERYPECWTFSVDGLLGATPELLIRREKGLVTSRVLAGTIRRTGDDDHDLANAASLARSSKDLEEHEYAVRSVARALAPFCSGMNVPDGPYVLQLPNVLHLATDITAVADKGVASLALAAALHPTAAVCGTPTDSARSLIAELEHLDRERYTGPVGWIDANGDGEWAIALRCGQLSETDPHQIRLFAGCGIVAGSDPAAELAESNAKLIPMRDSLG